MISNSDNEENYISITSPKKPFHKKQENVKKGRVIIRNFPFKITEEKLKKDFGKFGEISEVNLLKKSDGKLVGCAFVQYKNYPDSIKAIKEMHNKDLMGRKVTVEFALNKNRFQQLHPSKKEKEPEPAEVKVEEIKEESDEETEVKEEEENSGEESPESASESGESEDPGDDSDVDPDQKEETKPEIPKKSSSQDQDDHTIFIKNLSFDTTDEDLHSFFKKLRVQSNTR
jgi:nucleolar protein 4